MSKRSPRSAEIIQRREEEETNDQYHGLLVRLTSPPNTILTTIAHLLACIQVFIRVDSGPPIPAGAIRCRPEEGGGRGRHLNTCVSSPYFFFTAIVPIQPPVCVAFAELPETM